MAVPSAPTGFNVAFRFRRAWLFWDDISGVRDVEYRIAASGEIDGLNPPEWVRRVGATPLLITSGTLSYETQYDFELRGVNNDGEGQKVRVTLTTPNPGTSAPAAPTSLTATPLETSISFTYSTPAGTSLFFYRINTGSVEGGLWMPVNPQIGFSQITGLIANTQYTIALRASNFSGDSSSATVTTTTLTSIATLTISANPTTVAPDGTSTLTFTFSSAVTGFTADDIDLTFTPD